MDDKITEIFRLCRMFYNYIDKLSELGSLVINIKALKIISIINDKGLVMATNRLRMEKYIKKSEYEEIREKINIEDITIIEIYKHYKTIYDTHIKNKPIKGLNIKAKIELDMCICNVENLLNDLVK